MSDNAWLKNHLYVTSVTWKRVNLFKYIVMWIKKILINDCLHIYFFTSKSIFGVNIRVAWQIYVFKVKSCLSICRILILRNLYWQYMFTMVYIFRMQITLFTGMDLRFHSKFTFKMCVNLIACFECCKNDCFSLYYPHQQLNVIFFIFLPVSTINTIVHH